VLVLSPTLPQDPYLSDSLASYSYRLDPRCPSDGVERMLKLTIVHPRPVLRSSWRRDRNEGFGGAVQRSISS
jgi:hypothetical protein